jgi:plastocyanin
MYVSVRWGSAPSNPNTTIFAPLGRGAERAGPAEATARAARRANRIGTRGRTRKKRGKTESLLQPKDKRDREYSMSRVNTGCLLGGAALALLLAAGCGSDESPNVQAEIRIETARFFPDPVDIRPGDTVRWVSILPRSPENLRTVTSGTGPDDPDAGIAFDDTLQGYRAGSPEGESVTHTFDDPGTYTYFSRIPAGSEFSGTILVR